MEKKSSSNQAGSQVASQMSPLVGALTIASSVFVSVTSVFVAILALFAALHQDDSTGLVEASRTPSSNNLWIGLGITAAVLINGLIAGTRARTNPLLAFVTATVFCALTLATSVLYISTW